MQHFKLRECLQHLVLIKLKIKQKRKYGNSGEKTLCQCNNDLNLDCCKQSILKKM